VGKLISQQDLILERRTWEQKGLSVVLASGRFDLLHPGHVRLLEQARALGDLLVVAVDGDATAIAPAAERAEILAALAAVDLVFVSEESSEEALIALLLPDIVVKGGSEGQREMASAKAPGTRAIEPTTASIWVPLEPGYSTASLLERIRQIPT